ncbi:MAG: LuxR C-terminal-related transcriptional regulator, partial [Vibrio sp.]
IVIVSNLSLQASLLKELLDKSVALPVQIATFDTIFHFSKTDIETSLFVFDYEYLDETDVQQYIKLLYEHKLQSAQVLMNMPKNIDISEYLIWPNLVGVFYGTDSFENLAKGLNIILTGEFWFSRELSQKLIMAYRKNECPSIKVAVNLTEREKQIMQLLSIGASNGQIASSLFVSENTVKTHLHNIFKKINVKNRLQALMWLRNTDFGQQSSNQTLSIKNEQKL